MPSGIKVFGFFDTRTQDTSELDGFSFARRTASAGIGRGEGEDAFGDLLDTDEQALAAIAAMMNIDFRAAAVKRD